MPTSPRSRNARVASLVFLAAASLLPCWAAADAPKGALCIRRHTGSNWAEGQYWIPKGAVSVFTYEGRPRRVHVTDKYIACDYRVSGVLFDVASGKMVRRYTAADGWPEKRPEAFGPRPTPRGPRVTLVDPGLMAWRYPRERPRGPKKLPLCVAAEVRFGGRTFRAMQPTLRDIRSSKTWRAASQELGRWKAYLDISSQVSCIEAVAGGKTRRYTTADGLAGNIVSHLTVSGKTLWAACVDIYDDQKKAWGPGGLCRYDPPTDRWAHVKTLAGRPARWVTLLEVHGDELWVGFREGQGLAGEKIIYGMGLYAGLYRPKATAIVLARLKGGKWTARSRKPRPEGPRRRYGSPQPAATPPTEIPRRLAIVDGKVLLYTDTQSARPSGNFQLPMDGHVSLLDPAAGRWQSFALPRLTAMHVERGQVIVLSRTGAHQWAAKQSRWRRLETHCTLPSPWIQAVTAIGPEVWVGYANRGYADHGYAFAGVDGISRCNTRTGRWTFMSAKDLGTSYPVQVIAAGPDNQAWVLFSNRMWMEMAMGAASMPPSPPPSDVPAKPGVGRFADGKWTFPLKLAGVPASIERSRRGPNGIETWKQLVSIQDLAVAGGAVFVANQLGVYRGPGQWRKIHDGEVVRILPTASGRELSIVRYDTKRSGTEESKHDLGRYDPKTGKLTFRPVKSGELKLHGLRTGEFLRHDGAPSGAVRLPAKKPGNWYVSPLETQGQARLIETRAAFWIATPGQLIRIDRKQLAQWLGE